MKPFDYLAPTSIAETIRLLAEHGADATLLAGGQSLMILLRQGLVAPTLIISLKRVTELDTIAKYPTGLRLGSMVRYHSLASDAWVASRAPILAQAAASVGSVHIRTLGTVGGSLCHADPAGDVPTVLLALDATLHTVRADSSEASHTIEGFFQGLFETRLDIGELLVAVEVLAPPADVTFGYRRFSFRQGEYPMAVAACRLGWVDGRCGEARVAVGGGDVHPKRLPELERLLAGGRPDEVVEAAASEAVVELLHPMADIRGSADWKARVVHDLIRRTVADAAGPRSGDV